MNFKIIFVFLFMLFGITVFAGGLPASSTLNNGIHTIIENKGQWDSKILFQSFSSGRNIYFLESGLSFAMIKNKDEKEMHYSGSFRLPNTQTLVYNLLFEKCNKASIVSNQTSYSNINYLKGNDIPNAITSVPAHGEIMYKNIYHKTDLKYYLKGNLIEYDFILNPGANAKAIRLKFEGVENITISNNGDLLVQTAWGSHIEKKPFAFQEAGGVKKTVEVAYVLLGENSFGFEIISNYDKSKPLIIDPVILDWSTYVGGSVGTQCVINDMVVDALGFVYAAGFCQTSFPVTAGVYNGGIYDGFVMKMQPDGSAIVWATYIGGNATDVCNGIAVNALGEAFVCGTTSSNNFPLTAGAVDNVFNFSMPHNSSDAFVLKLNSAGNTILYSTFLGGEDAGDIATCIDLSGTNEVVVGGDTRSPNFPITAGAYDAVCVFAKMDGFVARININPTGGALNPANLLYSTFIGGDRGNESVRDLKFGSNGHIYFTGITFQPDYPIADFPTTSGALDNTFNGDNLMSDGFVCRINPAGSGASDLVYSTYIGAPATYGGLQQQTMSSGIALSTVNTDVVYVTGQAGWGFPTTAVSPPYAGGQGDVFVLKLKTDNNNVAPDITDLLAGRYMGGSSQDSGFDIAVDSDEEVFVTGKAQINFPITCGAIQTSQSNSDVFVTKLDSDFNIYYSTYLGGTAFDFYGAGEGQSIALFGSGCKEEVVICGTTTSADFPTTVGSYQPIKLNTGAFQNQGFIFKLADKTGLRTPDFSITQTPTACGARVDLNFVHCTQNNPATYTGWNPITAWNWNFGDGGTSSLVNPTHTYSGAGTYTISLNVGACPGLVTKTISITNGINVTVNPASASLCEGDSIILTAAGASTGGALTYSWSTGALTNTLTVAPSTTTNYSVIATDPTGCTAQTTANITVHPNPVIVVLNNGPVCSGTAAQLSASGATAYQWSPAALITNPAISNPLTVSLTAETTFSVLATDANGCTALATTTVEVNPIPTAFTEADTAACTQLCIEHDYSVGPVNYTYVWDFGDGTGHIGPHTKHCYSEPGTHPLTLTVKDITGCSNTFVLNNITIHPDPIADFSANPQPASLLAPTVYFTDNSVGASAWDWRFGDAATSTSSQQHTSFTYDAEGLYSVTLVVNNIFGCADTTDKIIEIQEGFALYIANTFTPNEDGLNDEFKPYGVSVSQDEYEFLIFDRWGNLIFKSNNINKGWDGKTNEGSYLAQQDTYVWKLRAKAITGEAYNAHGHVNLLR